MTRSEFRLKLTAAAAVRLLCLLLLGRSFVRQRYVERDPTIGTERETMADQQAGWHEYQREAEV